MSEAFEKWWDHVVEREEPFVKDRPICLQDAARAGWNACAEAAAEIVDSAADDFGAMGNDAVIVAMQQPASEIRALAAEQK